MQKTGLIIILLTLLTPPAFAQTPCSSPPSKLEMDKQFHQALTREVEKQKVRLAIFPLQDGSLTSSDSTLEKGFAIALFDFLRPIANMGIYHPFVILNTVQSAGLTSSDLFSDAGIVSAAESIGATHALFGMFQKQPGQRLRYFIKIADISQKKTLGTILEFVTNEGDRFHESIAEAANGILKAMGQKTAKDFAKKYLATSPSFESFRFYVKGVISNHSYDPVGLSIAKVWFEKSASLAYTFERAYQGKARSLLMLALIQKQMGKNFTLELNEAQEALRWGGTKLYGKKQKNQGFFFDWPNRWLEGHFAYLSGISLLQNNKNKEALKAFEKAAALIPEDGLSHEYLSTLYEKAKNPKANYEKNLAKSLNPCVR